MADEDEDRVRTGDGADNAGAETDAQIEERARRLGWVAKDEFRGDPSRWTSAAEFLERGEKLLPIAQERVRKLDDKLGNLERAHRDVNGKLDTALKELSESRQAFQDFRKLNEGVAKRAYDRARADILAERDAAVAAADPAAFRKADEALIELDKTKPAPVETRKDDEDDEPAPKPRKPAAAAEPPQVSDFARNWLAENKWFGADDKASQKATALHGANLASGMSEEDSLADVRASMEAMRPDLFENQRRDEPSVVIPPSNGAGRRRQRNGSGRTFDDLPQDAKDAYATFAKQDPKFTKEQYVKDYAWDA